MINVCFFKHFFSVFLNNHRSYIVNKYVCIARITTVIFILHLCAQLINNFMFRNMENYTSDSSDDNSNKVVEFSYLMLDTATLDHNLDVFASDEKKPAAEVESLILHHNRLSTVPDNIVKFSNLKVLDISSNGLTVLPDILMHCPLTSLIAKNNNFNNESLPKTFTVTSTMKELNLSGNNLTAFPEQVIDFRNLKYLYLSGNLIMNIPKDIKRLKRYDIIF